MAHAHLSLMLGVPLALGRGLGSRDSLRDGENPRPQIQGAVIGSLGNTHISLHQAATDPSLGPGPPKLCRAAGNHRPLPTHPTSGGLAQSTRALNGSPAFSASLPSQQEQSHRLLGEGAGWVTGGSLVPGSSRFSSAKQMNGQ